MCYPEFVKSQLRPSALILLIVLNLAFSLSAQDKVDVASHPVWNGAIDYDSKDVLYSALSVGAFPFTIIPNGYAKGDRINYDNTYTFGFAISGEFGLVNRWLQLGAGISLGPTLGTTPSNLGGIPVPSYKSIRTYSLETSGPMGELYAKLAIDLPWYLNFLGKTYQAIGVHVGYAFGDNGYPTLRPFYQLNLSSEILAILLQVGFSITGAQYQYFDPAFPSLHAAVSTTSPDRQFQAVEAFGPWITLQVRFQGGLKKYQASDVDMFGRLR